MYVSCICRLIHGHEDSQSIWCFYLSKEALFVAQAVIATQKLVYIQLGNDMCSWGTLFSIINSTIYFWHYDMLGGVHDVPHAML